MAAFNEVTGPDLDLYAGHAWSDWHHAVASDTSGDVASDRESKCSKHDKEVARLKKQDFGLFGYCPAKDNFFVVVCEHCRLPFKPQAFHYHMEKHHKAKAQTKTTQHESSTSKSGNVDQYFVKSPTPSETSNNSTGSIRNFVSNKPNQLSLSRAIQKAFHKVDSPTGSSPSHNTSPAKSNLGLNKFKWSTAKRKQSPSSMSSGSSGSHKSSPSAKYPFQEDATTKNNKSSSHHQVSPKQSKVSKYNSTLQPKHQKVKSEDLSKPSDPSMPHHHSSKHGSHSHHNFVKGIKRSRLPSDVDLPKPIKHAKKQDGLIEQNSSNSKDGLVVVLKKSAIVDKKPLKSPHPREPEKGNTSALEKNIKLTLSSSPFRQYKHHHNPQIDIVKSSDRGEDTHQRLIHPKNISDTVNVKISTKPKKILPSKAREYDPNKHCGVLVSAGTPCTRSLTCKTHARSYKRKVSGRAKPYDELVVDHAEAKKKMKEAPLMKGFSLKYKLPDASSTTSNRTDVTTSAPPLQIKSKSSTATPSGKTSSSASTKTASQPTSKSKSSILLFPRSKAPRHIDCWPDDFHNESKEATDPGPSFLGRHPCPMSVHRFALQTTGNCRFTHGRATDFQWRNVLPMLKGSSSKKVQKPSSAASGSTISQASCNFNPIPAVSHSILTCLKNAKDASKQQTQHRSDKLEYGTGFLVNNLPKSYATPPLAEVPSQQRHNQSHKLLSKPFRVEGDIILKRPAFTNHTRLQRSQQRTADSISGSSAKSPRGSMPLDHRITVEERPTNPLHGKFVQLTAARSQIPTSLNATNFDLGSCLVSQQNAESLVNERNSTNFIASVPSQRPNISLQTKFYKVKRMPKERKNSLPTTVNQTVNFNNHIVHRHYSEDASPSPHSTTKYQAYATSRPNIVRENCSTVATPFSDATKLEAPLINGLTSHAVSRYAIPQSVTLTGTIGALMQPTTVVNNAAVSSVKNVDLGQQYLYPDDFTKQLQHNTGDVTAHNAVPQGSVRAYISTAEELNGEMAADFI